MKLAVIVNLFFLTVAWNGRLETESRIGYVMPAYCVKPDIEIVKAHTTECALEPDCVETGFGLWTEDGFQPFDKKGNELAFSYFKETKRVDNHKVKIVGDFSADSVEVEEIVPIVE